jgi:hypothetical protein
MRVEMNTKTRLLVLMDSGHFKAYRMEESPRFFGGPPNLFCSGGCVSRNPNLESALASFAAIASSRSRETFEFSLGSMLQ